MTRVFKLLLLISALVCAPGLAAGAPLGPPPPGVYRLHAIDVGTGLSVFVEGADFALLYDAGSNDDTARGASNRVVAFLRAIRPDLATIDHVILSHPHKDHSELMPDVLAAYAVRNVWDSGALNPICSYRALLEGTLGEAGVVYHDALGGSGTHDAAFEAQRCYGRALPASTVRVPRGTRMTRGLVVNLGAGARMTFLHADGSPQSSFNENSVVVRLDLGPERILLPGDSEAGGRNLPSTAPNPSSVEGGLIACCAADLRSDILVAGHHGSKTSSRTAFLNAVNARQFIVSAGPTRYSTVVLPDREVVDEYKLRGLVWRTDLNDDTCGSNPAKIGPDNDGRAGGCDNVLIVIDGDGLVSGGYERLAD